MERAFDGFQCGPARELAHADRVAQLAQRRETGGRTYRAALIEVGSRVGATAPASVRIARCSRGYLTYLLTVLCCYVTVRVRMLALRPAVSLGQALCFLGRGVRAWLDGTLKTVAGAFQ